MRYKAGEYRAGMGVTWIQALEWVTHYKIQGGGRVSDLRTHPKPLQCPKPVK